MSRAGLDSLRCGVAIHGSGDLRNSSGEGGRFGPVRENRALSRSIMGGKKWVGVASLTGWDADLVSGGP